MFGWFKKLSILTLKPTKDYLGNVTERTVSIALDDLVDFVKSGGKLSLKNISKYFSKPSFRLHADVIVVLKFEDGQLFVHDGHLRLAAILLSGRRFLYRCEYRVVNTTYDRYNQVDPGNFRLTPFDPRERIKIFDSIHFKKKAMLLRSNVVRLKRFIDGQQNSYSRPRLPSDANILGIISDKELKYYGNKSSKSD